MHLTAVRLRLEPARFRPLISGKSLLAFNFVVVASSISSVLLMLFAYCSSVLPVTS